MVPSPLLQHGCKQTAGSVLWLCIRLTLKLSIWDIEALCLRITVDMCPLIQGISFHPLLP